MYRKFLLWTHNNVGYIAGLLIGSTAIVLALSVGLPARETTETHAQTSECSRPRIPYEDFWSRTDFCQHSVEFAEIRSGGPPPDGIPPIDSPQFESIEEAYEWLHDQSPVIALEVDGEARAYPLAILTRHEIANDIINDVPIAVTFCPLCSASVVFDRQVDDETLRFGVSGLLRNSDMVMWDDVTQSWWQQFTGTGIVGAHTDTQLAVLPSQVVGFSAFVEQYPDGTVLTRDSGGYSERAYGSNPYAGYDSSTRPFLYDGEIDDRLPALSHVLAGFIGGDPMAYPFSTLSEEIVINDTVGGKDVVAVWQPGAASALDRSIIDASRDIGMAALFEREVEGEVLTFSLDENGEIVDDQTGSEWNVFGTAIEGDLVGSQLRPELAAPHFWFAWAAFVLDSPVYGLGTE